MIAQTSNSKTSRIDGLQESPTMLPVIPRASLKPLYIAPLFLVWLAFLYYLATGETWSTEAITGLGIFGAAYGILLALRMNKRRVTFTIVYGTYMSFSNLGFAAPAVFFPDSVEQFVRIIGRNSLNISWYYSSLRDQSLAIAGLAICSFFLASIIVGMILPRRSEAGSGGLPTLATRGNTNILYLGLIIQVGCLLFLLYLFATNQLPLFESYARFASQVAETDGYTQYLALFGVSAVFIFSAGSLKDIRRFALPYAIQGLFLLLTGNRGEVFYAGSAIVAILSSRGTYLNRRMLLFLALVLLIVIPLIRQVRSSSLSSFDISTIQISPFDGVMELGYQLRPLVTTLSWITNGEDYANGDTYWIPVQRLFALAIPGAERLEITGHIDVRARLPGQGYSVVAEAFFNYGVLGAVVVLAVLGAWFALSDRANSVRSLAFFGAVAAILINSQRNRFSFVPGQIVIVIVLILIATVVKFSGGTKTVEQPQLDKPI